MNCSQYFLSEHYGNFVVKYAKMVFCRATIISGLATHIKNILQLIVYYRVTFKIFINSFTVSNDIVLYV